MYLTAPSKLRSSALLIALFNLAVAPAYSCPQFKKQRTRAVQTAFADDLFGTPAESSVDMTAFKGQKNWNAFMRDDVKPVSDSKATEGFEVLPGKEIAKRAHLLDPRVERNLIGDEKKTMPSLIKLADYLRKNGQKYTFLTIEEAMKESGIRIPGVPYFKAGMLIPLLSHGGVMVKFAEGNFGLSVNYATRKGPSIEDGEHKLGVQTGRTYLVAPGKKANGISDKQHCDEEQELFMHQPDQLMDAFAVINRIMLSLDNTGYTELSEEAQAFVTGFLAVMKAEGIRNHMDGNLNTNDWDRTLLRKTELGAYYAGLYESGVSFDDGVPVMYKFSSFGLEQPVYTTQDYNPYGDVTENEFGGRTTTYKLRKAQFASYWQRGDTWKPHTEKGAKPGADDLQTRSGLGVTNKASEKLEEEWTLFAKSRQGNRKLYDRLTELFGSKGENLSEERARFLFGNNTPDQFSPELIDELDTLWMEYLTLVRKNAKKIHERLLTKYPAPDLPRQVQLHSNESGSRINAEGQILNRYGQVIR